MSLCLEVPDTAEPADDELIVRFQAGDATALDVLLQRYRRFARAKARPYFLAGADADDVEQEAMIGLYKAVRDYRPDRRACFRTFAELCINRQVIAAVRGANRHKHQPLHRYVSTSGVVGGESDHERSVEDLLDDHRAIDPADEVCQRERITAIRGTMRDLLSGLEVEVLGLYVEGRSYQEISQRLWRHPKSIDNAVQRIKSKVGYLVAQADAADQADGWNDAAQAA